MIRLVLPALFFCLAGCALTPARQTQYLLDNPPDLPAAHRIEQVKFIEQEDNFCGPATLAMAMDYAGKPAPVEELAAQVFTPGKEGSLQQDMLSGARRQGMLAVQIQGLPSLLKEVEAGHPVIVFLNLGLSWYPIYHYALVTGYDLSDPAVVMHSGSTPGKVWNMKKFERSWSLGQYWGLVVLPVTELSAAASELEHSAAAAGLEALGHTREAELVYRNILKRWPKSYGALIGMGNLAYARGQFEQAVIYLKRAVEAHPDSSAAWHNLALAAGAAHMVRDARTSARKAISIVPAESSDIYKNSLKDWL
jgi:hypothetical protein